MRPSNLPPAWRIGLLVGLCLVLTSVIWTLLYEVTGRQSEAPVPLGYAVRFGSLLGWPLLIIALWKSRNTGNVPTVERSSRTTFRPPVHPMIDVLVWTYLPFAVFVVSVLAIQFDLPTWAIALLLGLMILEWPIFLVMANLRYEITDDALVVRGFRQSIRWADIDGVRAATAPLGEQFEFTRQNGRPFRIASPLDRELFLEVVRERIPQARFEV